MSGSFAFEIAGHNLRTFVAAIQALSAVGKEVVFQIERGEGEDPPKLSLSSLNDNASSYGAVTFSANFFARASAELRDDQDDFACKLVSVALAPVLRRAGRRTHSVQRGAKGIPSSTKGSGVLKLVITHEHDEQSAEVTGAFPKLCFELYHHDGVRRRWKVFYEAADVTSATFDKGAEEVGEIVAQPQQLGSILEHIRSAPEVEFRVGSGSLRIASRDDAAKGEGAIATTMEAQGDDFEKFRLPHRKRDDDEEGIAVGIKPARAIVRFCEDLEVHSLNFHYSAAGAPVAFAARVACGCEINFIVSSSRAKAKTATQSTSKSTTQSTSSSGSQRTENFPESRHSHRKHPREPGPPELSQAAPQKTPKSRRRLLTEEDDDEEEHEEEGEDHEEEP